MASNQQIFRQVALERLSTPEQLDQAMRVTSPLQRLMLLAVMVLLAAGLLWSVIATIPIKVTAQGILLSAGGVLTVSADNGGRITQLLVKSGDRVAVGQLLARLEQPDLRQELENARSELAELGRQKTQIVTFQSRDNQVQLALLHEKRRDLKDSVRRTEDRIKWLEERERNTAALLAKQIVDKQRYLNAKIDLDGAREALARANSDLKQVERDETAMTIGKERELLDKDMAIGAVKRRMDTLVERLSRQSVILSPYAGEVVELKVNQGELVDKNAILLSLLPLEMDERLRGHRGDLMGVVYVPPNDGKKVRPGMVVQVAPSTVKREEYGFILGTVKSVAEVPSTTEGMMRTLKNQQLAHSLSGGGAPFEVIVSLERDAGTPSGFRWSSSRGPDAEINTSTLAEAAVTVREIHLISLAVPALEALLDR
jgi:HlyD family secretion protein